MVLEKRGRRLIIVESFFVCFFFISLLSNVVLCGSALGFSLQKNKKQKQMAVRSRPIDIVAPEKNQRWNTQSSDCRWLRDFQIDFSFFFCWSRMGCFPGVYGV